MMNNTQKLTALPRIQPITPVKLPEEQSFLPMLHGKATDAMAQMSSRDAQINPITGSATVSSGEVKLVIQRFNDLKGTLGINTHKLLSVGIANFTGQNHVGGKANALEYKVSIPFREYAIRCGYDLIERPTSTPEEAEAEKRRLANLEKDIKKKIKKDLDVLRATELTWRETVKGKEGDYLNVPIIGSRGIKGGYIHMVFDPVMAEYLVRLPLTQYPVALLAVDARNSNAYSIGLKMTEYYNMDLNQVKGKADRLAVPTLLACTSLPSIEDVRAKRKDWVERIKEPFENALDALTQCGFLADWQYTHAKAKPLTDEEAANITDYETWAKLYVQFVIKDAPDQTARIEAKRERVAERKKKAASKKKSTSKPKKAKEEATA